MSADRQFLGLDFMNTSIACAQREAILVASHLKAFIGKRAMVHSIYGQMVVVAAHPDGTVHLLSDDPKWKGLGTAWRGDVYGSGIGWHARFDIERPVGDAYFAAVERNNAALFAAAEGRLFGFAPGPTLGLGGTVIDLRDSERLPRYAAWTETPLDNADIILYREEININIRELGGQPRSWPKLVHAAAPVTSRNRRSALSPVNPAPKTVSEFPRRR
jgi:hypothetical protein